MRIERLTISNILSFPPTDTPTIDFSGKNANLCLIIGPNGSGKSNFLEVLNQFLQKGLMQPFRLAEETVENAKVYPQATVELRQTVSNVADGNVHVQHLNRHRDHPAAPQSIQMSLRFGQADHKNMEFIKSNLNILRRVATRYSNSAFPFGNVPPDVNGIASVDIMATISGPNWQIQPHRTDANSGFAADYLAQFNFVQRLIRVYNRYERKVGDPEWPEIPVTFAFLGANRSLAAMGTATSISPHREAALDEARVRSLADSTKGVMTQEPAVFELVRRKIAFRFMDMLHQERLNVDDVHREIANDPVLKTVNELLREHLGIALTVQKPKPYDLQFLFHLDRVRDNRRIQPTELSSGENAILHFIFCLYGVGLNSGMIIIDEPELHLHPQMQRRFLRLLESVACEYDVQIIAATHAPGFVTTSSLGSIRRFTMGPAGTEVVKPEIGETDRLLARVAEHENAAAVFFAKKVVLVEGETDQHFLSVFVQKMGATRTSQWRSAAEQVAFLNIKGKGELAAWRALLSKFAVQVYFFGDWDNVSTVTTLDWKKYEDEARKAHMKAGKEIVQKGSWDGYNLLNAVESYLANQDDPARDRLAEMYERVLERRVPYAAVVAIIQASHPTEWQKIESAIADGTKNGTFILKDGELEDYLGLSAKGLPAMVEFCEHRLVDWMNDAGTADKRKEIEDIVERIVSD